MKRGLVMEGGAMRGLFTAGVTDVFLESGVEFDGAVGVSAGACFGCNYKTKQPGRAFRYNIRFCRDPRYSGVRTFLRTGDLYGAEFCYHTIPEVLDPFDYAMFERNPMEFWVVCTDVATGEPLYHRMPHLSPPARSSRPGTPTFRPGSSPPACDRSAPARPLGSSPPRPRSSPSPTSTLL